MPTNFQPKRLKLKLDIVEKPENRVHKLTDSNVSRQLRPFRHHVIRDMTGGSSMVTYVTKSLFFGAPGTTNSYGIF